MAVPSYQQNPAYQRELSSLNNLWASAGQLNSPRYNMLLNNLNTKYSQQPATAPQMQTPVQTPVQTPGYQQQLANLNNVWNAAGQLGSSRYNISLNQLNTKYGQQTPAPVAGPVAPMPIAAQPNSMGSPAPINMTGTIGMPAGPGYMQPGMMPKTPVTAPIAPTPMPAQQAPASSGWISTANMTPVPQAPAPTYNYVKSTTPGSILKMRVPAGK